MNPFTQSLLAGVSNSTLVRFVTLWDRLERLVIRVYKGGEALQADVREYAELRVGLLEELPKWQAAFEPYWKAARVGGRTAQENPFMVLLAVLEAAGFVNHRAAMQNLPAAREAINEYLISIQK